MCFTVDIYNTGHHVRQSAERYSVARILSMASDNFQRDLDLRRSQTSDQSAALNGRVSNDRFTGLMRKSCYPQLSTRS